MTSTEALLEEVQLLRQQIVILKEQLAWLQKQVFGSGKSEKFSTAQQLLQLEVLEE